ncbi:MAG: hypothetical protein REI78_09570 [Pedobacter sp.]|nr:hypothetical protein [Pedobacter sp.]MDQ8053264.1 hypothetical protein [Pedobacter sp.]
MAKKPIPFDFILDYLYPLDITIKSMFGVTTLYLGEKILLGLRQKHDSTASDGIWMATNREHHASLKTDLPSLTSIPVLGEEVTSWQLLPEDDENFEAKAIKICELIKKHDPRIGNIPKKKRK